MKQPEKYRTIIIEPSEIIREGSKLFLEKNPCFQVTACFPDLQSFEDKIIKEDVQIILFNPAIIKFYKPAGIRNLFAGYPGVCLIAILYQYVDPETLQNFDGILDIYDEGRMIPQKVIKIIETAQQKNNRPIENVELSDREKDILIAVAKGLQNKEIAEKLHISTHTVISHRKNIVHKTGIKTVSGLTLYALFNNLVSQDELL
ncbi:MAG: response regulator transcription factor [Candidatus Azobacteroides sp.]|nr:response regulator transcription factor [Candidatus Azobacteroides sp.]